MFVHADGDSATAEGGRANETGVPTVIRSARSWATAGAGDTGMGVSGTLSTTPAAAGTAASARTMTTRGGRVIALSIAGWRRKSRPRTNLYPLRVAKKIPAVKTVKTVRPAAKKAAASKKPALSVSIDYPAEGEIVRPGHYAVRLTAAGAAQAQLRVNGGEWTDCREAVGHYWLDWSPASGDARLEARARAGKGRWTSAPARACSVVEPS